MYLPNIVSILAHSSLIKTNLFNYIFIGRRKIQEIYDSSFVLYKFRKKRQYFSSIKAIFINNLCKIYNIE